MVHVCNEQTIIKVTPARSPDTVATGARGTELGGRVGRKANLAIRLAGESSSFRLRQT